MPGVQLDAAAPMEIANSGLSDVDNEGNIPTPVRDGRFMTQTGH